MSIAAPMLDQSERQKPESDAGVYTTRQFVTFGIGENAYGIDIMAVREIRSWTPTTQLPDQGFGACGVLDIRGSIVEVFDLSAVLGSGGRSDEERNGQVVLVVAIDGRDVGLAVDNVSDIVDAEPKNFAEPPEKDGKVWTIVRQDDKLISILDLNALFN